MRGRSCRRCCGEGSHRWVPKGASQCVARAGSERLSFIDSVSLFSRPRLRCWSFPGLMDWQNGVMHGDVRLGGNRCLVETPEIHPPQLAPRRNWHTHHPHCTILSAWFQELYDPSSNAPSAGYSWPYSQRYQRSLLIQGKLESIRQDARPDIRDSPQLSLICSAAAA